MLSLNGNIESKTVAATYSYSVSAVRTGSRTASVSVSLTLAMTDPDEWYRYRVKSSVMVNGALQEKWLKDDLSEWWGGSTFGPFEVFSGEVQVDYDQRKLDVVPCIWHPYSQGGTDDSCNWEGETGVWHPFVNANEDVPGAYDDAPAERDGGFLHNRGYQKLDVGYVIDAFEGVDPVAYVWREWSEWPDSLARAFRSRVWWETVPMADSYRLWVKVNNMPMVKLGEGRPTSRLVVGAELGGELSAGDSLMFGVQSMSGDVVCDELVWSEPVRIVSGEIDGGADGCSISPGSLDVDEMPDSQRVVVEWSYSGAPAFSERVTDIVSADGSVSDIRVVSDGYGTRMSTAETVHEYDFDVGLSVNGSRVLSKRVFRNGSNSYRISVPLSDLLSSAGVSKYDANSVRADVATWLVVGGERVSEMSSVYAGTLLLSRDSGRSPGIFRLLSTTNRGRVNDVYVEGETVVVQYGDLVAGSLGFGTMELVLVEDGEEYVVSSWEHGSVSPTAGGMYNVTVQLQGFARAGTFVEFQLRCHDSLGGDVRDGNGSWPSARVHVFDGTVYAWTEDGEWRKSPAYVYDGAKWNLAFEVYACCDDGKLRRR